MIVTAATAMAADKNSYSLFNPTPDRLLRDLTTDRPDVTESPFTVDAGRIQVESNLFGYWRSRPDENGTVTDAYEVARTNLRIGLTSSLELSLVWQPYGVVVAHPRAPEPSMTQSGVGGINVRLKYNVWGNDTFEKPGSTALALLPILVLPTDADNGISPEHVEGALVVPFGIKLTDKLGLAFNGGVAFVRQGEMTRHDAEYLASASLSYEWSDRLGTYYEVGAILDREDPLGDIAFVGTGFTYKLNKNLQFDAGVNLGITRASDRVNPFIGLSARF
jgi:hypothetical protein